MCACTFFTLLCYDYRHQGSLNPRAIIRERDPWDANLLPPEPQPEFYKTFEGPLKRARFLLPSFNPLILSVYHARRVRGGAAEVGRGVQREPVLHSAPCGPARTAHPHPKPGSIPLPSPLTPPNNAHVGRTHRRLRIRREPRGSSGTTAFMCQCSTNSTSRPHSPPRASSSVSPHAPSRYVLGRLALTFSYNGVPWRIALGNPRTGLCHADFFSSGAVTVAEVRSKARERLDPRKEGGARRPVEKIAPPEQGSDEWQLCRDALDSWVQRLLINRIAIHKVRTLPHPCVSTTISDESARVAHDTHRSTDRSISQCCRSSTAPSPRTTRRPVHPATGLCL